MGRDTAPAELTGWLARSALSLKSLVAGAPTADLQPLKEVLAGVRIVGLGEATHGTREFFQLKHRLLEFLVMELGFRTLAMEASASASPAVDAYVRYGIGEADKVLAGLGFWTWRTREVLAVIEWMRAYNRGRPEDEKVRFAGIDPQRCGASLTVLDSFLREAAPAAPERLTTLRSALGVLSTAYPGSFPGARKLVRDAHELVDALEEFGPEAADAIEHARILVRAADVVTCARRHTDPLQTAFAARDRHMADAMGVLLEDPSAKVALWAHNCHVMKGRQGGAVPALGWHLSARNGAAYYALGLLFGSGAFRARRVWPGHRRWTGVPPAVGNRIGPPRPAAVESRLAAACPGDHLVDLRASAAAPAAVRHWLHESQVMRSFGALVPRWTYRLSLMPTVPAEEYDGLAYVGVSSCSRPLP
ncbi:erythromycin esterase family protein [Kitasatospora sp. NPDC057541]|uniref:erythromycin esterase family protein n=1 Tax=unclassified Kitasatospora TaxID=2633591 RepID=UPI0036B7E089